MEDSINALNWQIGVIIGKNFIAANGCQLFGVSLHSCDISQRIYGLYAVFGLHDHVHDGYVNDIFYEFYNSYQFCQNQNITVWPMM